MSFPEVKELKQDEKNNDNLKQERLKEQYDNEKSADNNDLDTFDQNQNKSEVINEPKKQETENTNELE
jgi:hypothetical protein